MPIRRGDVLFLAAAFLMLGFIAGSNFITNTETVEKEVVRYVIANYTFTGRSVEMPVPAVDQSGNGVVAKIITTVRPGSGSVLVSIDNVFSQPAMELSGRTAAAAASRFTQIDLKNIDIIYSVIVNATSIEGPSAGAAMAVSIVAGLENLPLNSSVMITGTIDANGTIGQAGGIFEKALAAKAENITTFLVPKGQSMESIILREKTCKSAGSADYCAINYIQKTNSFESLTGMNIAEVADLGEALKYFAAG